MDGLWLGYDLLEGRNLTLLTSVFLASGAVSGTQQARWDIAGTMMKSVGIPRVLGQCTF